jgi:hypothetical protein
MSRGVWERGSGGARWREFEGRKVYEVNFEPNEDCPGAGEHGCS